VEKSISAKVVKRWIDECNYDLQNSKQKDKNDIKNKIK
jgi:hypothetical protein